MKKLGMTLLVALSVSTSVLAEQRMAATTIFNTSPTGAMTLRYQICHTANQGKYGPWCETETKLTLSSPGDKKRPSYQEINIPIETTNDTGVDTLHVIGAEEVDLNGHVTATMPTVNDPDNAEYAICEAVLAIHVSNDPSNKIFLYKRKIIELNDMNGSDKIICKQEKFRY